MSSARDRQGTRLGPGQVRFTFDGRPCVGRDGDTAASALLALGEHAFGRSVKFRRLRGVSTAGPEEPNALLTVGEAPCLIPNVPATTLRIREGLVLRSQNRWPSLRWDVASLLQAGGGFFGAGFYYKTFLWPSWRAWEAPIRALAGLGAAPGGNDLPEARVEHSSCDVLVAGGGPAGLSAALAAARSGARVTLIEREPVLGGELEFESARIDEQAGPAWIAEARAELERHGAAVLAESVLIGGSNGQYVAHREPGGLAGAATVFKIRPRAVVLALGAVERPIAFVDNDRPGVMLLGAAERFAARYGVLAGRTAVIFACHDRAYVAALRLQRSGLRIRAIVDSRPAERRRIAVDVLAQLADGGIECLAGHAVVAALGRSRVNGARVAPLGAAGAPRDIECDSILVSGGWTPAAHPGLQAGGERDYDAQQGVFFAGRQPDGRHCIGAAHGAFELGAALLEGHAAGVAAAGELGFVNKSGRAPAGEGDPAPRLEPYWRSPCTPAQEKRQFVDPQNDVTVADLRASLAEGFVDIEHVKRYTALGFGTEQGRIGGTLGAAILAELRGQPLGEVGISRPRPPYHPFTMKSLAGLRVGPALRVTRRTPLNDWHAAHGGVLDPMGLWLRPRYYRANGPDAARAAVVEARRVRETGGILDGSTLGKIEVSGPDAAAFLDFMYLTRASTLRPGRAKYMVNLREDGMVLDDGLALRFGPERFVVTTSSSHSGHMLSHFEHYRDLDWDGRSVVLTDVTDAWAVIAVAGPRSRDTLRAVLGEPWRASIDGLKHMDVAVGDYAGHALTVLRAGFSGELAYELHVRPAVAQSLWQALSDAGLQPYGLDALDILRVEKGYLTTSEINGETTPHDLNMDALLAAGNECVGRALLDRPGFHEPSRPRLVGLRAVDGRATFLGGAQLTVEQEARRPIGYVTSAVFSPALGETIGLALVAREHATEGRILVARDLVRGQQAQVRVCSPVHFDPQGERMKA